MNLFTSTPWKRTLRSLKLQGGNVVEERRREWRLYIKDRVKRLLQEAKHDLREHIHLSFRDFSTDIHHGVEAKNFDSLQLNTRMSFTGITFTHMHLGEPTKFEAAYERGGIISFGQSNTGLIGVLFYRSHVEFPQSEIENEYTISSGYRGWIRKFYVKSKKEKSKRDYIVYGHFEPWKLTEDKINRIIDIGIRFSIETGQGAKPSLYTYWLIYKNNIFMKGVFAGLVGSLVATIVYDVAKVLLQ